MRPRALLAILAATSIVAVALAAEPGPGRLIRRRGSQAVWFVDSFSARHRIASPEIQARWWVGGPPIETVSGPEIETYPIGDEIDLSTNPYKFIVSQDQRVIQRRLRTGQRLETQRDVLGAGAAASPASGAPAATSTPPPSGGTAGAGPSGPRPATAAPSAAARPDLAPARARLATLTITSDPPRATVYRSSDGIRLGMTPLTIETRPGRLAVTIIRKGFLKIRRTATLVAGRPERIEVTLAATPRPTPAPSAAPAPSRALTWNPLGQIGATIDEQGLSPGLSRVSLLELPGEPTQILAAPTLDRVALRGDSGALVVVTGIGSTGSPEWFALTLPRGAESESAQWISDRDILLGGSGRRWVVDTDRRLVRSARRGLALPAHRPARSVPFSGPSAEGFSRPADGGLGPVLDAMGVLVVGVDASDHRRLGLRAARGGPLIRLPPCNVDLSAARLTVLGPGRIGIIDPTAPPRGYLVSVEPLSRVPEVPSAARPAATGGATVRAATRPDEGHLGTGHGAQVVPPGRTDDPSVAPGPVENLPGAAPAALGVASPGSHGPPAGLVPATSPTPEAALVARLATTPTPTPTPTPASPPPAPLPPSAGPPPPVLASPSAATSRASSDVAGAPSPGPSGPALPPVAGGAQAAATASAPPVRPPTSPGVPALVTTTHVPLVPGTTWTYSVGGGTLHRTVDRGVTIRGEPGVIVQDRLAVEGVPAEESAQVLVARPKGIFLVARRRDERHGFEPVVPALLLIELGATGGRAWITSVGDGRVDAVVPVGTPAGTFQAALRVMETARFRDPLDTSLKLLTYESAYAPGVGLVARWLVRRDGGRRLVSILTSFRPGEGSSEAARRVAEPLAGPSSAAGPSTPAGPSPEPSAVAALPVATGPAPGPPDEEALVARRAEDHHAQAQDAMKRRLWITARGEIESALALDPHHPGYGALRREVLAAIARDPPHGPGTFGLGGTIGELLAQMGDPDAIQRRPRHLLVGSHHVPYSMVLTYLGGPDGRASRRDVPADPEAEELHAEGASQYFLADGSIVGRRIVFKGTPEKADFPRLARHLAPEILALPHQDEEGELAQTRRLSWDLGAVRLEASAVALPRKVYDPERGYLLEPELRTREYRVRWLVACLDLEVRALRQGR